jgi:hypothetical protein
MFFLVAIAKWSRNCAAAKPPEIQN